MLPPETPAPEASRVSVVAVAGASGFIGSRLVEVLSEQYQVIGLSRHQKPHKNGIEWRACDLYSLLQAEQALAGADYAFYLVHSMMPMASLTQGSFEDIDLILADNFARAASKAGVKQIIYLGGIIPSGTLLSRHLRSRLEVEQTLAAHGVPVTRIRASLIVGARGSSFQIVEKLVKRLPLILCPRWTRTLTQPIALKDVLEILQYVMGKPEHFHHAYDVGGPSVLSYVEVLRETARQLGKKRLMFEVSALSPRLSCLAVARLTQTPRQLITPLMESLKDAMVAHDLKLQEQMGQQALALPEAIALAFAEQRQLPPPAPKPQARELKPVNDVRSVQRLPLPKGKDAIWMAEKYTIWLPRFFRSFIRVEVDSARIIRFILLGLKPPLLVLTYSDSRSSPDRTLFYITGGLLARETPGFRGRLEFREVLNGRCAIAAIHDFTPSLPWFLYNYSQALVHLWVMNAFIKYLKKLDVWLY